MMRPSVTFAIDHLTRTSHPAGLHAAILICKLPSILLRGRPCWVTIYELEGSRCLTSADACASKTRLFSTFPLPVRRYRT